MKVILSDRYTANLNEALQEANNQNEIEDSIFNPESEN